jgi:hypothetical protein
VCAVIVSFRLLNCNLDIFHFRLLRKVVGAVDCNWIHLCLPCLLLYVSNREELAELVESFIWSCDGDVSTLSIHGVTGFGHVEVEVDPIGGRYWVSSLQTL